MAGKNIEKVRKAAVLSFFWAHVRKLEARIREATTPPSISILRR